MELIVFDFIYLGTPQLEPCTDYMLTTYRQTLNLLQC